MKGNFKRIMNKVIDHANFEFIRSVIIKFLLFFDGSMPQILLAHIILPIALWLLLLWMPSLYFPVVAIPLVHVMPIILGNLASVIPFWVSIRSFLSWPLTNPKIYARREISIPSAILLKQSVTPRVRESLAATVGSMAPSPRERSSIEQDSAHLEQCI